MGSNRCHGGINLGNQGVELAQNRLEFRGKPAQVEHRQLECALDADDLGAPPNQMVQFALVGSRWRIGAQADMLLRDETGD